VRGAEVVVRRLRGFDGLGFGMDEVVQHHDVAVGSLVRAWRDLSLRQRV
jgi:hypothetical protein